MHVLNFQSDYIQNKQNAAKAGMLHQHGKTIQRSPEHSPLRTHSARESQRDESWHHTSDTNLTKPHRHSIQPYQNERPGRILRINTHSSRTRMHRKHQTTTKLSSFPNAKPVPTISNQKRQIRTQETLKMCYTHNPKLVDWNRAGTTP